MGAYAGKGHAAVDPNIIPLGSEVYIEGYGYAICDDIGGAIHGNIIDVGVDNYDQAYKWGMKPKKRPGFRSFLFLYGTACRNEGSRDINCPCCHMKEKC